MAHIRIPQVQGICEVLWLKSSDKQPAPSAKQWSGRTNSSDNEKVADQIQ